MPRTTNIPNEILKVLQKEGKNGMWLKDLAREVHRAESTIIYHIDGIEKEKVLIRGGSLKGQVETVRRQGVNRFVRLKK